VRKMSRADELTAAGKTGEQIAAELGCLVVTRGKLAAHVRRDGPEAAKELKVAERAETSRLKKRRLLAEAERTGKGRVREVVAKGNSEPAAKRRAVDMHSRTTRRSERLACRGRWATRSPTAVCRSGQPLRS